MFTMTFQLARPKVSSIYRINLRLNFSKSVATNMERITNNLNFQYDISSCFSKNMICPQNEFKTVFSKPVPAHYINDL